MRIPSGSTDRYIYFVAVDATDFSTRETGLSSFTVYLSRNGGAAAVMTTPTINETSSANMPGVYELLLDEGTTVDSGHDTEELCMHITHAGMAPVSRTVELYRPDTTEGRTILVDTNGAASADVILISGDSTAADNLEADYDGTGYVKAASTIGTCTTLTGHTAQTGDSYARLGAPAGASVSADIATVDSNIDAILVDTNEIQVDWTNGGRLDLILDSRSSQSSVDTVDSIVDAILVDTGTTIPGDLSTIDANVDSVLVDTGTSIPATLATIASYIDTEVAAIKAVTDNLPDSGALTTISTGVSNIETDTQDIQARLPAALVGGKINADATAVSGSATAADVLEAAMTGAVTGQAATGTLSTTQMTTNLSESTDDHYIGRLVTFNSGVLSGQQSDITDYDGASKLITFTALTEAPSNGDTFIIT